MGIRMNDTEVSVGMRCIPKMSLSIACRLDVNVLSKTDRVMGTHKWLLLITWQSSTHTWRTGFCVSGSLVVWENYQALTNTTNRSSNYVDRKFRFKHVDQAGRYKCSKCAKSYRWKHHLVEHVKASCGQKKAECCPYCSYKSNRKWNLKSHIKRIHASV